MSFKSYHSSLSRNSALELNNEAKDAHREVLCSSHSFFSIVLPVRYLLLVIYLIKGVVQNNRNLHIADSKKQFAKP